MSTASVQHANSPIHAARCALTFCQILETIVSIAGDELSGASFVDECTTIAIAHDGLIVRIPRSLALDQEVFVRRGNHEILARVMSYSRDGTYGLSFDSPEPRFWSQATEEPDEGPLDVPEPAVAPDPLLVPSYAQFEESMTPKPEPRGAERRRSPRITMRQAKGCIHNPGNPPDIVELINISRGGLCFRSHLVYPPRSELRIAAPYMQGGNNLFVRARVVRVHRDSWGGVYGIEYIR